VETIYQEQVRLAQTSEEIRVRLILSRTRPEADAVIGILAQGAAFEAVAAESSIDDATRYSGGDLGYRTIDVMPEAYKNALRDRPAGSTVGPFQTEGGWAVLRVEDRRRETPPTLEQARPQIVRYLTYEGVRQLLEELRGKAEVENLLPGDTPRSQEPASAPRPPAASAGTPAAPASPPAATAAPAPRKAS
jgi:peptidyl-prolyl cis-trans isomerase C